MYEQSNDQKNDKRMTRGAFFKRLMQVTILAVLSLVVFMLGNKVVTGKDCDACPGKGICNGETDCENY